MITGVAGSVARTRRSSSNPSMPGIFKSVTITSGVWTSTSASADSPPACALTSWPSSSIAKERTSRRLASSSTRRILAIGPLRRGKLHGHDRASSGQVVHFDATGMRFHDPMGDGEAESGALVLVGEDRGDQVVPRFRRDTGSGVGDPQEDAVPAGRTLDLHGSVYSSRLGRVQEEIEQDLPDLLAVGQDFR